MIRLLTAASLAVLAIGAGTALASDHKTVLKISTTPGATMKYTTTTLRAEEGVVTIVMKNASILPHDIAIKGHGVKAKGKLAIKGGTSIVTARLKKGRYTFYCTVAGHEQAGMKGTLIVH